MGHREKDDYYLYPPWKLEFRHPFENVQHADDNRKQQLLFNGSEE